mgnify:CR=1 FL=1
MNNYLFYFTVLTLVSFSFWIGKKTEKSQNTEEYFLGNRKIKFFQLTLTFLATQLGGGVIMGTMEASYNHGAGALLYGFGLSSGLIVLSLGVGSAFRRLEVVTIPEIFEKVYQAPLLRRVSSVISIISLFLILVAICLSTKKFLWSVGVKSELLFVLFWFVTTYYTVMGGYKAVVRTDALQVGFILVVLVLAVVYLLATSSISISLMSQSFETQDKNFPWFAWLISPMLFVIIGQDMGQRCFSGYSEKIVAKACFWSGFVLFLCTLLPCYMGLSLRQGELFWDGQGSLLLAALKSLKNPYLMSLFCAALLMAILSTADSLLCAIASHLAEDFPLASSGGEKKKLFFSRTVTFALGVLSLIFASFATHIIELMILAYKLCVSTLFVPIFFSILFKGVSKKSAIASVAVGFFSLVFTETFLSFDGKELLSLGLSALAFVFFHKKGGCVVLG